MKTRAERASGGHGRGGRALNLLAVGVLLLTAVLGAFCQRRTEALCAKSCELLGKAVLAAKLGDLVKAEAECDALGVLWERELPYLGVLYDHDGANRICESMERLRVLSEQGAREAFLAEAAALESQLEALARADRLSGSNLF